MSMRNNNRRWMKRTRPAVKTPAVEKQSRRWWMRFLESSAGTALITVLIGLIGGLLGSLVTSMAQSSAKTKEFKLAAYKDFLEQEREIVFNVAELIDQSIAASDDLITITGEDFDPARYPGIEPQKLSIRQTYNTLDRKWRSQYHRISFAIGYYHRGRPDVIRAWTSVQEATTRYMDCAHLWHSTHSTAPVATASACKVEKDALKSGMAEFNERLSAESKYVWQEWQSLDGPATAGDNRPDEMR